MEYIIVGDTKDYKECLIYPVGKKYEDALGVLERMLTNPTENDRAVSKGHTNLRIKQVEDKDCWWNDPVLCN
jgi:hypothetical protein